MACILPFRPDVQLEEMSWRVVPGSMHSEYDINKYKGRSEMFIGANGGYKKFFLLAGVVAAITAMPAISNAIPLPVYNSSVRILGGNAVTPGNYYQTDIVPGSYDYSGGVASNSDNVSYTGLDGNGDSATMQLQYNAQAQASATGLKSSAMATLTNAFYNAANDPFVTNTSFDTDPNGIPSQISVSSAAVINETLTVVGAPDLATLVVSLTIDGTTIGRFSPDNYVGGAVAQVYRTGGCSSYCNVFSTGYSDTLQSYNDVVSAAYSVVGGDVNFGLELATRVDYALDWSEYGGDAILPDLLSGSADFFNTVTIGEFRGYNASGAQVNLVSVTGSGGQQYNVGTVSTVPEPASLALMSAGLVAFSMVRRARSANRKH